MVTPVDIYSRVPTPALYEQLAEECVELAHAALKAARIYRKENPTPVNYIDAINNMKEEFSDLMVVADILGFAVDENTYEEKIERWFNRLEEFNND